MPPIERWVPRVRIEDAAHNTLLETEGQPNHPLWVPESELRERTPAYLCFIGYLCTPVTTIERCERREDPYQDQDQNQHCPDRAIRLYHGQLVVAPPSPPPPCDTRVNSRPALGVLLGVGASMGSLDGQPHGGLDFTLGTRRFIPPASDELKHANRCDNPEPNLAHVYGGAWLGSEIGTSLRGSMHWSMARGVNEFSGGVAIAPIARITVAEGAVRLPSVLGLFLPEIGFRMRSRTFDAAGSLLTTPHPEWSITIRPAGLTIGYVFAQLPVASIELQLSPSLEIPLNGQPVRAGFLATAWFSVLAWG